MKKILYIGSLNHGQTSLERMKAMEDLGYNVVSINVMRPVSIIQRAVAKILRSIDIYPDFIGLNRDIRTTIESQSFDLVWVDKGIQIKPSLLRFIKNLQPNCHLAHLNPDDPFGKFRSGWGLFLQGLQIYDTHFVARTPNIEEYLVHGGRNVHVYDRSFSLTLHRPIRLSEADKELYGTQVGFIGSFAPEREAAIAFLIRNGIPVSVYGDGWQNRSHWNDIRPYFRGNARLGDEYVKTINGMNIALHFLRRENRDEQDSRTFEIPACGVCMIAERSPKHEELFKENIEAVFFDTHEELLSKVVYYLAHPIESQSIGSAARKRSISSGYDHHSRMKNLLGIVFPDNSKDVR